MSDADTLAQTLKGTEAQNIEAARKQVRFDSDAIDNLIPRIPRSSATTLRRLSANASAGTRMSTAEAAAFTETIRDEDDENSLLEVTTPADYDAFLQEIGKLPKPRYNLTLTDLDEDFEDKVDKYAQIMGKEESAGCTFLPLTEAGNKQWPKIKGTITLDSFENMFKANPNALYQEFKLRNFGMQAAREQIREHHEITKSMSIDIGIVTDWAHHLGTQLADTQTGQSKTDPALTARIKELEAQVADSNAAIADLIIDRRRQRDGTPNTNASFGGGDKRSAKYTDPPVWTNNPTLDDIPFKVWLRRLTNKLDANADHWPTERLKLGYVEGKLGGDIATAVAPYLEEGHPDRIETTAQLLTWLNNECDNPNKKIIAKEKYRKLMMKNSDSFQEFRNRYVGLAGETHLKKTDWKAELHDKMADVPRLRNQLVKEYLNPQTSFEDYCLVAQQVALDQERTDTLRSKPKDADRPKAVPTAPKANRSRAQGDTRGTSSTGNPWTDRAQRNNLTKDELIKRSTEGLCYNCGQKGHLSRDCPTASATPGGNTTARTARIEAIEKAFADAASNKAKLDAEDSPQSKN